VSSSSSNSRQKLISTLTDVEQQVEARMKAEAARMAEQQRQVSALVSSPATRRWGYDEAIGRDWSSVIQTHRYAPTYYFEPAEPESLVIKSNPTIKIYPAKPAEDDDDMAKTTPRNLYTVAVVAYATDAVDIKYLVAENEAEVTFTVTRGLPDDAKASDYEIKILRTDALKPKVS
jgi:hypothetical protein